MLRELTKSDWQTLLAIPDDRVPEALILRGTRDLKGQYAQMRGRFSDVVDVRDPNVVVDDVFLADLDGIAIAYASVYGAPMASEIAHLFGVMGARLVLQIGCCGALAEDLMPGDLFTPSSAYCGEGASQYYRQDGKEASATAAFVDAINAANGTADPIGCGRIYTTSALFAESREDVVRWGAQGFRAIDMETAATFSVAERFGMERAALLFVYDCPLLGEHILLDDAEKSERRRLGNGRMIELAFDTVKRRLR